MKIRNRKRQLYTNLRFSVLLPRQFVNDMLRGVAEANALKAAMRGQAAELK